MEEADFVVVGGGPSGLFLTRLLHDSFPNKSIIVINEAGKPSWFPFKIYMINVISLIFWFLLPSFSYTKQTQKRQFANNTCLGGCTNLNGGVAVIPTEEDVKESLGETFVEYLNSFVKSKWISQNLLSSESPYDKGLDSLSLHLIKERMNKANIFKGGKIHMFAKPREAGKMLNERIHPVDFIPVSSRIRFKYAHAKNIICKSPTKATQGKFTACGVLCEKKQWSFSSFLGINSSSSNDKEIRIMANNEVFVCCGGIESPKILIRSGYGPESLVRSVLKPNQKPLSFNQQVGQNLQDHFVQRFIAKVPEKYNFRNLYPCVLGYKFRFKDICFGFGKFKPTGTNLFSVATAKCIEPGEIIYDQKSHSLQPILIPGSKDLNSFWENLAELKKILKSRFQIQLLGDERRPNESFSPNWHYCGTLSMGRCVAEDFKVIGFDNLRCCDLSVLKNITSMNTQMMSYFLSFVLASVLEKSSEKPI